MKKIVYFAFAVSAVSLASALTAEYGFGLKPCELCIAQRVPYAVILVICLLCFMKPYYPKFLPCLIALLFFMDSSIAVYHSGVEKHWIQGPDACTSSLSPAHLTPEELLKKIEGAPIVACDQPAWEFHGITMAVLNSFWSFSLGIITILLIRRQKNA